MTKLFLAYYNYGTIHIKNIVISQGALVVYDVTDDESFKVVPQWIKAIDDVSDVSQQIAVWGLKFSKGIQYIYVGPKEC